MFENSSVYIDPSFSGTGVFVISPTERLGSFNLISRKAVKKSLEAYFLQSREIATEMQVLLRYERPSAVYMESPVLVGFASSGLYMLQTLLLEAISNVKAQGYISDGIYSILPNYVKGAVSREYKRRGIPEPKQKIKSRQDLAGLMLSELKNDGWKFTSEELVYKSGTDDCATAFFFWALSDQLKDDKQFLKLNI